MDAIQECMQMTSYGGEAKSLALLAMKQAREGEFKQAEETLEKAHVALVKSHQSHTNLLSYDAEAQDLRVSIFMVHAADHLNSAEVVNLLAKELVYLYRRNEDV